MANYVLENGQLKVSVHTKSAELISIVKKETGVEYLWNGDSRYWGWSSPVLFPFVGSLRDKKYTYQGQTYHMNQHGFARNQEFTVTEQKEDEIWFALDSSAVSREEYPFDFHLEVGYLLRENHIRVCWKVKNTDNKMLWFSIGAHPAFMCPLDGRGEQTDYYMGFETDKKEISYRLIDPEKNLVSPVEYPLELEAGLHRIEKDRFDQDALIIEHGQTGKMWLAGPDKKPYVSVEFDAPLFGVWSPAKRNAPFVCIEPWYGRSDSVNFHGTLEEREYINCAQPGEIFERFYGITIL